MNQAEAKLAEARSLAASFGLDQQAIDTRTASVQRMRQQMTVAAAPAPPAVIPAVAQKPATPAMPLPVPVPVSNPGEEMLSKAALELRSGNTDAARRIAEEVYRGPYQLQDKALAMIRSAAAEENNQRILAADRAFSTAKTAMQSRDYRQADALLKQIDPAMLSPEKQRLYGEYVQTARTETRKAEQAQAAAAPKPTLIPVAAVGGTGPVPGVALTGEAGSAESFAKQVEALQTIEFQRFREDGLKIQREATALFQKGETDASIQMLADYIASVKASSLEPSRVGLLTRSADHRMQQFKMLKAQQDFETRQRVGKEEWRDKREKKILGEEQKHQQVKALMSESRQLLDEGKYREAEMKAMQANELDPDDPSTGAAVKIAQVLRNQAQFDEVKKRSERLFVDALDDAEDVGPSVNSKSPVALDAETFKRAKGRASLTGIGSTRPRSDREREIERRLTAPVSLNFSNVPLRQAIEEMRAMTGINIIPDMPALEEDRVSMETPVTMKLDNVSLKSSLNLLLGQVKLTYVVKDEVLQVTTERHARGKLSTRTFSVADLVIPVDNYAMPAHSNLAKLFEDRQNKGNFQMINNQLTASGAGQAVGQPLGQGGSMNPTMTANGSLPGGVTPSGPMAASSIQTNAVNTLENQLIRLITSTIAPNSWSDVGGAGTIQYFPLGMAMVIGQTPDVQEQVADLLEALRRLQDLEVSVELRLISLSESFFERIGLDFNINIKTDKSTRKIEPQLINAQNPGGSAVKAPGQIQDLTTKGVILGLTPAGTFTNDLDIPIRSSSFEYAIPPFGGYPNIPGANGGLSLGMAFLNDIQVFMFMEAAQGDKRVNVMQAPKLTLFNGQSATINVQEFQFFVTNVALYSLNGQLAFLPENTPLPLGLAMTVQAVVSADRRFVRLNLAPQLNNLALGSAQVPLFPVTSFITPTFDGGFQGQPIPFTQFVQQPNLTTISIQTTVSVPDGGTVLLGGLKTLSEGRNEFGPPVLSKVPYINRLFKNVGYGREAQSLLLMVTPRIIINAEEEDRQTGVGPTGPQAQ
jgi:type II secretory pathway component GspD/PulD (secretin)